MAGYARRETVREGEIGVYRAWSRCVQRAFLCGLDPLTGDNYDYRRNWIERLLEYLAGVFCFLIGQKRDTRTSVATPRSHGSKTHI